MRRSSSVYLSCVSSLSQILGSVSEYPARTPLALRVHPQHPFKEHRPYPTKRHGHLASLSAFSAVSRSERTLRRSAAMLSATLAIRRHSHDATVARAVYCLRLLRGAARPLCSLAGLGEGRRHGRAKTV